MKTQLIITACCLLVIALFVVSCQFGKKKHTTNAPIIRVGVVTWGGYAGGQYFNEGFDANTTSRFYKEYGFKVRFYVLDDFMASRDAFKNDKVDLIWATADALPAEYESLASLGAKVVFLADWSRGGDAIVARQGINSPENLKGKKIAVAPMTPSHSLLLAYLEKHGLQTSDVKIVEMPSAIDAAAAFKHRSVDAAVVWRPDDEDCMAKVPGATRIASTKDEPYHYTVPDVLLAKSDYINENKERLAQLFKGWLQGSQEINESEENRKKAAKILAEGLGMGEDFCLDAIENGVYLANFRDNLQFFGLERGREERKRGQYIFTKMQQAYTQLGYPSSKGYSWENVVDASVMQAVAKQ